MLQLARAASNFSVQLILAFKLFIVAYIYKEDFYILNFSKSVNSISIVFILHSNSYLHIHIYI